MSKGMEGKAVESHVGQLLLTLFKERNKMKSSRSCLQGVVLGVAGREVTKKKKKLNNETFISQFLFLY